MNEEHKLRVLCMTEPVAYLARSIGKEYVSVYTLIPPLSDPHSYQLVKGDDELFAAASCVLYSGLGLEHSTSLVSRMAEAKSLLIGDEIVKKFPQVGLMAGRSVDPHVWMDVAAWAKGVDIVLDFFIQLDPLHEQDYRKAAQETSNRLAELHKKMSVSMQQLDPDKRFLVTTHDAFSYFARAYLATDAERLALTWRCRSKASVGLAPDSQISTKDIDELVQYIMDHKIKTLFSEYGVASDALDKIFDVCTAKKYEIHRALEPLFSDSVGPAESKYDTYEAMLLYDARVMAKEWQGTAYER